MSNNELEKRNESLRDSVRCMSEVLTDIANELDIPEKDHGDPDCIFDNIAALKHGQQQDRELIRELVEALNKSHLALYRLKGFLPDVERGGVSGETIRERNNVDSVRTLNLLASEAEQLNEITLEKANQRLKESK